MSGIEATKEIKARLPEIGILILSAYSLRSYILDSLSAGANGYLLKDVPLPELIKAIHMVSAGDLSSI